MISSFAPSKANACGIAIDATFSHSHTARTAARPVDRIITAIVTQSRFSLTSLGFAAHDHDILPRTASEEKHDTEECARDVSHSEET
jgi:hypothetical protein